MNRARAWIGTVYSTEENPDWEKIFFKLVDDTKPSKAVGQHEIGEKDKRNHLQVALYFNNKKCFNAIQDSRPGDHFEWSRNWTKIKRYCSKEDTRVTGPWFSPGREEVLGTNPGKRTDIEDVANVIIEHGIDAAIDAYPGVYMRMPRGFTALHRHVLRSRRTPWRSLTVQLLYGDPGLGKTRRAYENYPDLYRLCLGDGSGQSEWWDGYQGEDCVLIDDFYGQLPLTRLLAITDGYPLMIPVKGEFTYALFTKIIFTSNYHWDTWYARIFEEKPLLKGALERRFTNVTAFRTLGGVASIDTVYEKVPQ